MGLSHTHLKCAYASKRGSASSMGISITCMKFKQGNLAAGMNEENQNSEI